MCRAWFAICAPEAYRQLSVDTFDIYKLLEDQSEPGSHICQYATKLTIRGPISSPTLAMLSRVKRKLPHLNTLLLGDFASLRSILGEYKQASYHPTHLRVATRTLSAICPTLSLTHLRLVGQRFHSSADVLRLLSSFPRVNRVSLKMCAIDPSSVVAPSMLSINLHIISVGNCTNGATSLTRWWQWPQVASSGGAGSYPGLHKADLQLVESVLVLFEPQTSGRYDRQDTHLISRSDMHIVLALRLPLTRRGELALVRSPLPRAQLEYYAHM